MALRGSKALQEWCRRVTSGYRDVLIQDMSSSFRDGLAFCAIIHHFRPDLIDYDLLKKEDILYNNQLAFDVAEKKLGIVALLDAPDMALYNQPDKLSVITYVSSYYNYFKDKTPGEIQEKKFEEDNNNPVENEKSNLKSSIVSTEVISLGDICQVCNKKVYILERQIVNNKLYHRGCYRCCKCKNTLKAGSYLNNSVSDQLECLHCSYEENKLLNENESSPLKVNDLIHSYEKTFVKKDTNDLSSSERRTSSPLNSLVPNIQKSKDQQKPIMKKPNIPVIFKRIKSHVSENKADEIDSVKVNHTGGKENDELKSSKEKEELKRIERTSSPPFLSNKHIPQIKSDKYVIDEKKDHHEFTINDELEQKILVDGEPAQGTLSTSVEKVINNEMVDKIVDSPLTEGQSPLTLINSVKEEEMSITAEEHTARVKQLEPSEVEQLEPSSEVKLADGCLQETQDASTDSGLRKISPTDDCKLETEDASMNSGLRKIRPTDINSKSLSHRTFQERKYKTIAITSPEYPQHLNPFLDEKSKDSENNSSTNPFEDSDDESLSDDDNERELENGGENSHKLPSSEFKTDHQDGSGVSEERKAIKQQRRNPFLDEVDGNDDYPANHLNTSNIVDFLDSALEDLDMGKYDSNLCLSKQPQTSTPNSQLNLSVSCQNSLSESPLKKTRKKRCAPPPPENNSKLENGISKFSTMPSSPFRYASAKPRKPTAPQPFVKKVENSLSDNSDDRLSSSPSPSKLSLLNQSSDVSRSLQSSPRSRKKKPAPPPPTPQRRKVTNLSEFGIAKEAILMELQELDHLQTELESKARHLEKALRCEGEAGSNMEDELLVQWFEIVNEKNKLVRREAELIYIQRQQELEEKHSDIEYELRCLLEKPMSHKNETDQLREEKLLAELVNIVTERNLIVECIEEERLRQIEEDEGLEQVMTSKGLDVCKKPSGKFKIKSPKKLKKKKK